MPRRLIWRLWLGSPIALFGWLFAAIGMAVTFAFLPNIEVTTPDYDRVATATIDGVEHSGSSENEHPIYRVHYVFVDHTGVAQRGASYSRELATSGRRPVRYVGDDPTQSSLDGMRGRPFGSAPLFVVLFPIVGLALALSQLRTGRLATRLLRHGVPTRGRLIGKEETGTRINRRRVMALTFEYEVGGATHRTVVKTLSPEPLEDDEEEAMLYDPQAPASATTLDHLPGQPSIGPGGVLIAEPGIAVHVLIMPAVTAGLLVATVAQYLAS